MAMLVYWGVAIVSCGHIVAMCPEEFPRSPSMSKFLKIKWVTYFRVELLGYHDNTFVALMYIGVARTFPMSGRALNQ